jgi:single-strand DNA-binding protein
MLNCVTLIGRLTADPELRTTTTGKSVANFRIAVDRAYSKGDNKQTDFITIVAWENTADFISKYFGKGSMIALRGEIQTRNYEDKDGNKRTATEVLAREVSFCGGKNETSPGQTAAPAAPTYTPAPADFEEIGADDVLPY